MLKGLDLSKEQWKNITFFYNEPQVEIVVLLMHVPFWPLPEPIYVHSNYNNEVPAMFTS